MFLKEKFCNGVCQVLFYNNNIIYFDREVGTSLPTNTPPSTFFVNPVPVLQFYVYQGSLCSYDSSMVFTFGVVRLLEEVFVCSNY